MAAILSRGRRINDHNFFNAMWTHYTQLIIKINKVFFSFSENPCMQNGGQLASASLGSKCCDQIPSSFDCF